MRKVRRLQTGEDDPDLAQLEMLWRDPSTPTRAQAADAAVKTFQAGIVPLRQTRRDLGYTSVQIKNMEREDAAALAEAQRQAAQQAATAAQQALVGQTPPEQPVTANPARPERDTSAAPAA